MLKSVLGIQYVDTRANWKLESAMIVKYPEHRDFSEADS